MLGIRLCVWLYEVVVTCIILYKIEYVTLSSQISQHFIISVHKNIVNMNVVMHYNTLYKFLIYFLHHSRPRHAVRPMFVGYSQFWNIGENSTWIERTSADFLWGLALPHIHIKNNS